MNRYFVHRFFILILVFIGFAIIPNPYIFAQEADDEVEIAVEFEFEPAPKTLSFPLSWALHGSIFFFAANNGVDSSPAPIIPSGGGSLALQLFPSFRIEFTEDIYFQNYEYNPVPGYPMASDLDYRSAFVMGFITGVNAVLFIPLDSSTFRLYGGLAADIRIITKAAGLKHPDDYTGNIETDVELQKEAILKYFWEKGRWLYPTVGFGFDFPLNENFLLGFDIRTWLPVYRIWTNENIPAVDGWRFGAGLRITPITKK